MRAMCIRFTPLSVSMGDSEEISFSDIVPREYHEDELETTAVVDGYAEENDDEIEEANETEEAAQYEDQDLDENEQDNGAAKEAEIEPSPTKKVRRFKSEVKKPNSKWILFSAEVRPQVMAEFPQHSFAEVAKVIAERYRNISAQDSERFDELVNADKERYRRELAEAEDDAPASASVAMDDFASSGGALVFPMSKVRKACKLDPEVKAISKDAVPLITKAVELFVGFLARKCAHTVSLRGVRSVREADVIQTILMNEQLEFLRVDFPRKAAPAATAGSASGKVDSGSTTPKHRVVASKASTAGNTARASAVKAAAALAPAGTVPIASFFGGQKRRASETAEEAVEEAVEEAADAPTEQPTEAGNGGDSAEVGAEGVEERASGAPVEGEYVMVEPSEEAKEGIEESEGQLEADAVDAEAVEVQNE